MMTTLPLLIGAGNPFRRDDGVGAAVVAHLGRLRPAPAIDVVETSGETADLVERWRERDLVFLVDAAVSGAPPGSMHRVALTTGRSDAPPPSGQLSSHGLGIAEALALGRVLDALPCTLVIFAVEAADVSHGAGLSPPVADAVERVVDAVVAEVAAGAAPSPPEAFS